MIKHVVFMKFKDNAGEDELRAIREGLAALPRKIPEIHEYVFGRDVGHSERSYDFALVSAFENLEDLEKYRVHPAHQAVVEKIRNASESILAVDFEY